MRLPISGLMCVLLLAPRAWAKDPSMTDDTVQVREVEGHRLLLPNDWPVQRENSQVTPISTEEYLSLKFGQVRQEFASVETHLASLEQRIKRLEQGNLILQQRLHEVEQTKQKEVDHGDTTQER